MSNSLSAVQDMMSHSGVAEDSGLLECDMVSLGKWFLMFLKIVLPSSSSVNQSFVLGCCTHL